MTQPPNTRIDYLYRDGGNFKAFGHVVVGGRIAFGDVRAFLDQATYFNPEMVGFPRLSIEGHPFDPDLDHDWCELEEKSFRGTDEPQTIPVDARLLVERFRTGSFRRWITLPPGQERS